MPKDSRFGLARSLRKLNLPRTFGFATLHTPVTDKHAHTSIIGIGATNAYVMHALLAFSASHMTYLNECPIVGIIADEHRVIALKGLQEAIGTFSRATSDAILAASLVLSWQATDW